MSKKNKKRTVQLVRRNWDADFFDDIISGRGFIISEPAEITLDGVKRKSLLGPQSSLYGSTYEDEHSFIERYRCECGAFVGKKFEGHICPKCGTEVTYKDSDVNITGWICLKGENKIVSPYYYQVFVGAIGKNVFPDIVNARYIVNKDGERIPVTKDDFDSELSSPFAYIGIDAFYDRYEEIIEYFRALKPKKASTFDRLLNEKRNVFVSHIPIMSNILRPQSITTDTFYFNTIDKLINTLYTLSTNLQSCEEVERDYILQRIQEKVNGIWDIAFETLNRKTGLIRGELESNKEVWFTLNSFNCWNAICQSAA